MHVRYHGAPWPRLRVRRDERGTLAHGLELGAGNFRARALPVSAKDEQLFILSHLSGGLPSIRAAALLASPARPWEERETAIDAHGGCTTRRPSHRDTTLLHVASLLNRARRVHPVVDAVPLRDPVVALATGENHTGRVGGQTVGRTFAQVVGQGRRASHRGGPEGVEPRRSEIGRARYLFDFCCE